MSAASTASRRRCSRSRPSSRPSTRRSWRRRRGRRSWPCAAETWRSSSGDGPSSRARSATCGKAAADLGERRRVLRVWGPPGRSVMSEIDVSKLNETVREESLQVQAAIDEVKKVIVGQKALIDRMMVALLCRGHLLVEGLPGLAKTLAVKTLGQVLDLQFARIQFTPDLLPADLTGTMIFVQKTGEFAARKGPVFTNLLLADEINRAPAKVQSALLEAMQERQVTLGDTSHPLPAPFLVFATQNPIEQEGTYPLPEAQIDRFLLKAKVDYPKKEEERQILDRMLSGEVPAVERVLKADQVLHLERRVRGIYLDDRLRDYMVALVTATRRPKEVGLVDLAPLI